MEVIIMFLIFNKQKIYTYIISVIMVILLFCIAGTLTSEKQSIATSSTSETLLPIYKVQTEEKKVALTMNCAWNADDIDNILKTLEENQVKITFFIVGEWAEKYPEAVKKIYEAGHEIGTHSDTHPHVNNLSYEENIEELENSNDKIESIIGTRTNLYRTPYGEYNQTVIQSAQDKGYYTIQWSLDTLDYTGITGEEMWNRIKDKINSGDIILMHNGTDHTADSLDMILKNIKEQDLEIVKISDLIYEDNYIIDTNGTQISQSQ